MCKTDRRHKKLYRYLKTWTREVETRTLINSK